MDVDEAGPGQLHLVCNVTEVQLLHDSGTKLARVAARLLRQAHDAVGLVVTELHILGLLHDRLRVQLAGEFTQKGRDATVEVLLEIHGVPGSGKSPDFTR